MARQIVTRHSARWLEGTAHLLLMMSAIDTLPSVEHLPQPHSHYSLHHLHTLHMYTSMTGAETYAPF